MTRFVCAILFSALCTLSAADAIHEISNAKEFDALLASSKGTVVVDFHAEWCGPCKVLGPILEEVAKENSEKMVLLKVDVDQNVELVQRFGIEPIPAVLLFKDGKQIDQRLGIMDKETAKKFIGL